MVILTARDPERLKQAATGLDALSSAAFDATDGGRAVFSGLTRDRSRHGARRPALIRTPRRYGLRKNARSNRWDLMNNTTLTGATYDIDGGQQFVAA